ncbi:MAG: hypothetical protein KAH04_07295 [Psychrilyobacter sp.]|nr:hypothetical protein [Psychrilyobacter sp.]
MKSLNKIIILTILLTFIGCSKNLYVKNIERGYSKSKDDKTIYIQESEHYTLTKKKIKYDVYDNQHFLVLKEDNITHEKSLYLALKYRGDDWIYMNALDLISNTSYHIDFMTRKMSTAFWRDKSNLVDSVEEYVAFILKPEEIEALQNLVDSDHGKIKYYSEIEGKGANTVLTEEEIDNMKSILELYSK